MYKFYFWWRVCSVPSLRQSWITANSVNSQLRDIAPSRRYSSRLLPCKFGAFLILPTFSPAPSPLLLQVAELNAFPHIPAFFDLIRKIIWTHLLVLWCLQQFIQSRNGSLPFLNPAPPRLYIIHILSIWITITPFKNQRALAKMPNAQRFDQAQN